MFETNLLREGKRARWILLQYKVLTQFIQKLGKRDKARSKQTEGTDYENENAKCKL